MKKEVFSKLWLFLAVLSVGVIVSCSKDDEGGETEEDPIASFQFEVSTTNFLEVSFTNFSQNATSYSWDFGDGSAASTDESPTHTYASDGSYEVTLTASNGTVEVTKTQTVSVSDPEKELKKLTSDTQKTWILQRQEVALGIGPSATSVEWWSFGGVTPFADRPCILDDEYTFTLDGDFILDSKGTMFLDGTGNGGWNNTNPDVCNDESEIDWTSEGSIDVSAFANGGDYTYTFDGSTLTLQGEGVYIGLANKSNAGDLGSESAPQDQIVYQIIRLVDGEEVDSLQLSMKVGEEETYWNFWLVHYDNESLKPEIPTESEPFGEDLPDETPAAVFNTFASTDAADVVELVPTTSSVVITSGIDDPAGGATKVGQYVRGTADAFSDLKFQLDYDMQLDNFTQVSVEVYFPSSNTYTEALTQRVDIFLADASQTQNFWEGWELYRDETATAKDEWITFTFDLGAALDRADIDLIGLKIGGENHNEDGTFYVRNFKFE